MALALVVTAAGPERHALAGPDPREIQARQDFVEGRYQQALDLFARLYAETLHPNYLRNIGRCYQNLKQPDGAISSFRDYLHKAKGISPAERQEIEGYIKEMEDLKAEREAKAQPATEPAPPPPVTPLPSSPQPESASAPVVVSAAPAEAPPAEKPVYERWWFWALIGGAVAVGVGAAAAAGAFTKTEDASCPMGISCR